MVIDTSAVLAILFDEDDAERFALAMRDAETCRMSVGSYLEAAIIVDNRGDAIASREFERLLRVAQIILEPVTFEQVRIARQAYRDFGKGRHPAGLNFGDCLSYALAKDSDEPLLFKGADFAQTDVRCVR